MRKIASVAAVFAIVLLVGCGNSTNNNANVTPTATTTPGNTNNAGNTNNTTDAVTSASVVDNEEAFKKAISADGTWIAATLKDLTFTEDLVLDGQFTNKDEPARKIALYTQDANHNITNSYKLTAPKLTIKSKNARIQGGTFIGDVYVEAEGFSLVNATVEGNVYFTDAKYQSTFDTSDQGKVTGVTEVKQ
ncbi:hypothetical protein ACN6KS_21815 [Paenibacillus nitricinens]|uniref:hypothetical protein n=1 Tax=Paenibacillus nitricinens TaxID=3367691 RepID=UPI003F87FD5B